MDKSGDRFTFFRKEKMPLYENLPKFIYLYNSQMWIGQVRKLGPGVGGRVGREMIIPVTRASQGRPNTHLA